jgi:hypothetical protein
MGKYSKEPCTTAKKMLRTKLSELARRIQWKREAAD